MSVFARLTAASALAAALVAHAEAPDEATDAGAVVFQ